VKRDDVIATLRANEAALKELGVRWISVFGSVARGEANPNDVDLVVAFDDAWRYSLVDLERLKTRLSDLLGTAVDLSVEPIQKDRLRERIERELVRAF
jgi:predicted nucleotidyltransferase